MKKLQRLFSFRTIVVLLFTLLVLTVMGSTATQARYSDLHASALQLAAESTGEVRSSARNIAIEKPGAILRANVIK